MTIDELPFEFFLIIVGSAISDEESGLKNELNEVCFFSFKALTFSCSLKSPKTSKFNEKLCALAKSSGLSMHEIAD